MRPPNISVGDRYGTLTVVEVIQFSALYRGKNVTTVECVCDCGRKLTKHASKVKRATYCARDCSSKPARHDPQAKAHHPLRATWENMIARCTRPTATRYERYGGRGIAVCERWRKDFWKFAAWSQESGWQPGLQIDRINNDGNYEPGNCRWATAKNNMSNRHNTRFITAFGETKRAEDWLNDSRCQATSVKCITTRIVRGDSAEDAIACPPRKAKPPQKACAVCGVSFVARPKTSECCSLKCGIKLAFFRRHGRWPPGVVVNHQEDVNAYGGEIREMLGL